MSDFFHILPLPMEYMRKKTPPASNAITWLSGEAAVRAFWKMRGVKIDIFAQLALSSSNIGLEKDYFETFSCESITDDCICAMSMIERAKNSTNKTFLKANCDFATLELNGPFISNEEDDDIPFEDKQIGFTVNFSFDWEYGISASLEMPTGDYQIVGDVNPTEGSSVPTYMPLNNDTEIEIDGIKYLQVEFSYLYNQ